MEKSFFIVIEVYTYEHMYTSWGTGTHYTHVYGKATQSFAIWLYAHSFISSNIIWNQMNAVLTPSSCWGLYMVMVTWLSFLSIIAYTWGNVYSVMLKVIFIIIYYSREACL